MWRAHVHFFLWRYRRAKHQRQCIDPYKGENWGALRGDHYKRAMNLVSKRSPEMKCMSAITVVKGILYSIPPYITVGGRECHEPLRVVLGDQAKHFTEKGIKTFSDNIYTLTVECDRMGFRLDGPEIEHVDSADIISDGAVFGSIQVPSNGHPIVLMADRQTTGGYTKIGTIITADLPRLANCR